MVELREYIRKVRWQEAKRTHDHEYTVKNWSPGLEKEFEKFVAYIYEYGFRQKFKNSYYKYVTIDNYTYWAMGLSPTHSILINRKKIEGK